MDQVDDIEAFDRVVLQSAYPMFIVTATGDHRSGCLVGFATQASINPRRLLVMLSKNNHTFGVAQQVEHLAVHYLGRSDHDLSLLFGEETGDQLDKFARCEWDDGPEGTTVLTGTRGWAVGRIVDRFDVGDHVGHLLEVVAAHFDHEERPLTSLDVMDMEPGHGA